MTSTPNKYAAAAGRRKPVVVSPPIAPVQRKYTVLIEEDLSDAADAQLLVLRRKLGKRVDRSTVVRELLAMLVEDPSISDAVAERLALLPD